MTEQGKRPRDRAGKSTTLSRRGVLRGSVAGGLAAVTYAAGGTKVAQAQDDKSDPMARVPLPPQVGLKDGMAALPGANLYYWDTEGDGEPIVLVHPASGSAVIWGYQQPVFAKAGYRVIAYSRRGYFKSDPYDKKNPGAGSEDLDNLATFLKLPKFHLVASAAGGSIAMDFALSHPERLLSLTISSNSAGVRDGDIFKAAETIRPAGWAKMPVQFRELGPSYRAANPAGAQLWLELEHQALVGTEYRQKVVNKITNATLTEVKVPTLLIAGDADLATPPSIMRMVAARIPGSEVVIVHESGHSVYWERPNAFNRAVLDFVGKHKK
jgi:pimeloyl-ACP methyl ester carboxylesterase